MKESSGGNSTPRRVWKKDRNTHPIKACINVVFFSIYCFKNVAVFKRTNCESEPSSLRCDLPTSQRKTQLHTPPPRKMQRQKSKSAAKSIPKSLRCSLATWYRCTALPCPREIQRQVKKAKAIPKNLTSSCEALSFYFVYHRLVICCCWRNPTYERTGTCYPSVLGGIPAARLNRPIIICFGQFCYSINGSISSSLFTPIVYLFVCLISFHRRTER